MQRGGHVERFGVAVGAFETDISGARVGADALEEVRQARPRPLANIVPALDADMADDDFLFRQRVYLRRGPRRFVVDQPGEFKLPLRAVDRLDVLDLVIGVEARRLDHLIDAVGWRQLMRIEQQRLHAVVEVGHRAQHRLHRVGIAHRAAGQHGERAERHRAAQQIAPVDIGDQFAAVIERRLVDAAFRPEDRA